VTNTEARRRLVFPLDYASLDDARAPAASLAPFVGVMKVGLELFVREGPPATEFARSLGLDVFLDLKLHDIPETVERAVSAAASLGVRYLTVHAVGGERMLARAVAAAERAPRPLTLLAVTMLTSLDDRDLGAIGVAEASRAHVVRLAKLAWTSGVRGFVASPAEAAALRTELGPDALLVTPGVRPHGFESGDQKRVATPAAAIGSGADLLVVGRPIRDADDPAAAARAVVDEIGRALETLQREGAAGG
jgi:orotidine-5'-phosphate decarboxylase